jgi:TPR repeat protein
MTREEKYAKSRSHYDFGIEWLTGLNGFDGEAVTSPATAMEEFIKAAKLGHDEAQYLLAYMYENGIGSAVDIEKAIEWYNAAASQNHLKAIKALARLRGDATEPPEDEDPYMSLEEIELEKLKKEAKKEDESRFFSSDYYYDAWTGEKR